VAEPRDGPPAGLCETCRFARAQSTARGSTFWRCLRAETDKHFPRYPRLPVRECPGYERSADPCPEA